MIFLLLSLSFMLCAYFNEFPSYYIFMNFPSYYLGNVFCRVEVEEGGYILSYRIMCGRVWEKTRFNSPVKGFRLGCRVI